MADWKWPDFWGFLKPDDQEERKDADGPPGRRFRVGWGTAAGKILAVLVVLAVFGTLATLLIVSVVRFFVRFLGKFDELGPP